VLDDLGVDRTTLFDYDAAATELERIVDHATTVVTVAGRRRTPVPDDAVETLAATADEARNGLERAMSVLLDDGTAQTACDVLDSCECVDVSRFDQVGRRRARVARRRLPVASPTRSKGQRRYGRIGLRASLRETE